MPINPYSLAEAVRAACIESARTAYETGGILGLCAEGRWDYAISAMQQLDIAALIPADSPDADHSTLPTPATCLDGQNTATHRR